MTKDDFRERCAEADHVWEAFEQHQHPGLYACANCLTYARRDGATMATIMCGGAWVFQPGGNVHEAGKLVGLRNSLRRRHHSLRPETSTPGSRPDGWRAS